MTHAIYGVTGLCNFYGIARSTFYREVASGRLTIIKCAGRTLIEGVEAERWWNQRHLPCRYVPIPKRPAPKRKALSFNGWFNLVRSSDQALMEPTMHDKLLDEAYEAVESQDMGHVIDVCGHSNHIWNPQALEKLRRGLGRLAVQWNMAAIEFTERDAKE